MFKRTTILATSWLLTCVTAVSISFAQQKKARISDKTLLAWVQLANLDQRAGSVLTIQDFREFDGIVFGEVRPRTWMPGSHRFHRTNTKQDLWPQESAGPDQMVQLAIVYKGRKISLYRNGQPPPDSQRIGLSDPRRVRGRLCSSGSGYACAFRTQPSLL